jgi:hypothetical protein
MRSNGLSDPAAVGSTRRHNEGAAHRHELMLEPAGDEPLHAAV